MLLEGASDSGLLCLQISILTGSTGEQSDLAAGAETSEPDGDALLRKKLDTLSVVY